MKKLHTLLILLVLPMPLLGGCFHHDVRIEPVTLAPIHMTLDVNLHVDRDGAGLPTAGSESPPTATADVAPASTP